MEVIEDGNIMDRIPILLQRDLEYYQVCTMGMFLCADDKIQHIFHVLFPEKSNCIIRNNMPWSCWW